MDKSLLSLKTPMEKAEKKAVARDSINLGGL